MKHENCEPLLVCHELILIHCGCHLAPPVFAYVGGLVVFMSTFIRFVVHYIFRGFFFIVRWWKLQHGARDGNRPRTESPIGQNLDEIVSEPYQYVEYEGQTIGCRERDLGDDVTSVSSIADEQGFVNASIG